MDGAQFLEQVRAQWPDTVRLLLTGYADMSSTIDAINRGEIYRYIAEGEAFFEAGYQAQLHDPIYLGMKARREVLALQERPEIYVSNDEPGANGR